MKTTTRVAISAVTAVGAAFLCAVPANAVALDLPFQANATSVIAKLNQSVVFPETSLVTTLDTEDFVTGTVTGELALPQATTTTQLGPITLATITLSLVDASEVSGDATFASDFSSVALDVNQSFKIRIDKIAPLGIGTGSSGSADINLLPPGSVCETSETTANLTGALDLTGQTIATTLKGSYDIPAFSGCGALVTPLLNTIVSGPDNTLSVDLTVADPAAAAALRARAAG